MQKFHPIMNLTETTEYSGFHKRKPTSQEISIVMAFVSKNSMLRQLLFKDITETDGSVFELADYNLEDLDNDPEFEVKKIALLAKHSEDEISRLTSEELDLIRDDFNTNSFVYDFVHLKTRIVVVTSVRIYSHSNIKNNLLSCGLYRYMFCAHCDNVHAIGENEMFEIQ